MGFSLGEHRRSLCPVSNQDWEGKRGEGKEKRLISNPNTAPRYYHRDATKPNSIHFSICLGTPSKPPSPAKATALNLSHSRNPCSWTATAQSPNSLFPSFFPSWKQKLQHSVRGSHHKAPGEIFSAEEKIAVSPGGTDPMSRKKKN